MIIALLVIVYCKNGFQASDVALGPLELDYKFRNKNDQITKHSHNSVQNVNKTIHK